jgi:signal transduction histidine kinase
VNESNGVIIKSLLKSNHAQYTEKKAIFNLKELLNKDIDLMTGYISNEPFVAKEKNIKINILNPADYGFDGYGDILITSEKLIKNNPELVYKMYEATKKGWLYAFENIEEVSDIIYDKYNTLNKSKKSLIYEGETLKVLSGYKKNFGKLDLSKLKAIGQLYSFMTTGKYNIEKLKDFEYKPPKKQATIDLTPKEQEYLNSIDNIPTCYDTLFSPYTMMKDGKPLGVTVDYLKQIEKKIHKKFKFIYTNSADKQYKMAYEKKCVVIPLTQTSPPAVPFIVPTLSAGKDNLVLVTQINEPYIFNMKKLKDKIIGVDRESYSLIAYLNKEYPYIKCVELDGYGLSEVENGDIFACIGTSIMMNYSLSKRYKHSLKVMKVLKNSYIEGSIGVHRDEPILLSILNKAVASLAPVTQDEIFNKWIDTRFKKVIDYTLVWKIIAVSFILILIALLWNRRLNTEIKNTLSTQKKLKEAEKSLKSLNNSLEKRVESELVKNKKQQLIMMEQIKLAQMGEMIANIAHQWRQPLSQVNSSVLIIDMALQKSGIQNKKIDSKLEAIERLTQYMSNTIDSFQNFFNQDKEKTDFFLKEVIDNSLSIMQGTLASNFTIVEVNVDESLVFKGYPVELQQVVVVILSNANDVLKTRKIKNPKIIIDIAINIDTYTLSFCDNAGGVEGGTLEKVFEPYYTTKYKSQGRGVGLYMAKIIIEEGMCGKLSVENKHNGACFSVEILKDNNDEA